MSFTALNDVCTYGNAVSNTVYQIPTGSTLSDVEPGDLICIGFSGNVSATAVASVTDDGSGAQPYDFAEPLNTGNTQHTGFIQCIATGPDFGSAITVTLTVGCSRRGAVLEGFRPSNQNAVLEIITGSQGDTANPITGGDVAPPYDDCLAVQVFGWRGGAVASGFDHNTPAGWIETASGLSGGVTTRVEANMAYDLNVGSTSTFNPSADYSSLTVAGNFIAIYSDQPRPIAQRRIHRVRHAWAGA